jgi:hypothetical protein
MWIENEPEGDEGEGSAKLWFIGVGFAIAVALFLICLELFLRYIFGD